MTDANLDKNVLNLHIMRAEIEAVHGKTFPNEPQLQKYFEERYWYKADPKYNSSLLSETEKANIATLATAEKAVRRVKVEPGDMGAFESEALPASALEHSSLMDLRLMRNEFYARHGLIFRVPYLTSFFGMYEWYKPTSHHVDLSETERHNVDTIVRRENELHHSLNAKALKDDFLTGMLLEDLQKLRNEVYARHGKVFKDKALQNYFSSLAWYKPNPDYRESMLTPIERENVKLIAKYEEGAQSQMNSAEG
jgi:hypothetical protein